MTSRSLVCLGFALMLGVCASCSEKSVESHSDPPGRVSNLSTERQTNNSIILTWTVPDDTSAYPAEYYSDVRYALAPITAENWDSAAQAAGVPNIASPVTVTGLSPASVYHFAVKIRWKDSDWSEMSDVATGTTLAKSQIVLGTGEAESANGIASWSGGGYFIVGTSTRYRSSQWFIEPTSQTSILRVDADLDLIQQRDFVFADGDGATAVTETSVARMAVLGTQAFVFAGAGLYVLLLDGTGMVAEQKVFYSCTVPSGNCTAGHGIVAADDGGVAVLGEHWRNWSSGPETWLVRLDAGLNITWEHFYADTIWRESLWPRISTVGQAITTNADGGLVVTGYTSEAGFTPESLPYLHHKLWAIKTDRDGSRLWRYVAVGDDVDEGRAIVAAPDGGFMIAGTRRLTDDGPGDVFVLKIDDTGSPLWEHTYGSSACEEANCMIATADGGYLIGGAACPASAGDGTSHADVYLLKIDAAGGKIWEKTYGGPLDDAASGITAASNGGYVVVGTTNSFGPVGMSFSNVYILSIEENGELKE